MEEEGSLHFNSIFLFIILYICNFVVTLGFNDDAKGEAKLAREFGIESAYHIDRFAEFLLANEPSSKYAQSRCNYKHKVFLKQQGGI
ncbi:hypothetical protein ACS0TY_010536 [Phlomoides rotata]